MEAYQPSVERSEVNPEISFCCVFWHDNLRISCCLLVCIMEDVIVYPVKSVNGQFHSRVLSL